MNKLLFETKDGRTLEIEYDDKLIDKIREVKGEDNVTNDDIALFLQGALKNAIDNATSEGTDQVSS